MPATRRMVLKIFGTKVLECRVPAAGVGNPQIPSTEDRPVRDQSCPAGEASELVKA